MSVSSPYPQRITSPSVCSLCGLIATFSLFLSPLYARSEPIVVGGVIIEINNATREIESISQKEKDRTVVVLVSRPLVDRSARIGSYAFRVQTEADEYFTGLTERVSGIKDHSSWKSGITTGLSLRGERVEAAVHATLGLVVPVYLSSRNYGLSLRGSWPATFDFAQRDPRYVEVSSDAPRIQFEIISKATPQALVSCFASDHGAALQLPDWAFRPWLWRNEVKNKSHYSDGSAAHSPFNSQVTEDLLVSRALGMPVGVYWIDRPWSIGPLGYDTFTFDKSRFPQAYTMLGWMRDLGVKPGLWLAPWLTESLGKKAEALGLVVPHLGSKGERSTYVLDFTNPKTSQFLSPLLLPLLRAGIQVFKLDRADEDIPDTLDSRVASGATFREHRNEYPVAYQQAIASIARTVHGDNFVLLSRAGFRGSGSLTAVWGGDVMGSEEGLRASIIGAQRAAAIGVSYWGSDTGGYRGKPERKLFMRWILWSAFTPIMEILSPNDQPMWNFPRGSKKNGTGTYDRELLAVARFSMALHERLVPYSVAAGKEFVRTGVPIVRPLFLAFPDEKESWERWDEYLYGPDILVAPVWNREQASRTVYLPKGTEWIDGWNPERRYAGGQTVTELTPLGKMPLFVRASSPNPLGDLKALMVESQQKVAVQPKMAELEQEVLGRF